MDPFHLSGGDFGEDGGGPQPDGGGMSDGGPPGDARPDACIPMQEVCDTVDNDCDGEADEDFNLMMDPSHCGSCGNECFQPGAFGTCNLGICAYECKPGKHDLNMDLGAPAGNGCEYDCIPTNLDPVTMLPVERCDDADNDCDGLIDEDFDLMTDLNNCGGCGQICQVLNATPECQMGTCGFTACNDGFADLSPTIPGCEYQCPVFPTTAEACNLVDDDCDGLIDEGNPGGGGACGDGTGECTEGTLTCQFGSLVCTGGIGPTAETCDGLDNDCDTQVDETFNFASDVKNCGGCGIVCSRPNALASCQMSACQYVCKSGYHDLNGDLFAAMSDGCEYACVPSGPEVCDGKDNDCDGLTDSDDPDLLGVSNFCRTVGECAGTEPVCAATACDPQVKWRCVYSTAESTACGDLPLQESLCDDSDGDCDGATDESFTLKGTSCADSGVGICQGTGVYVCNATNDGVECNITTPGATPTAEVCNGADDNCDGIVDNPDPMDPDRVIDDMVRVDTGTLAFYIYRYEASRPDADGSSGGVMEARACSKQGVIPWRNVTWTEASAACQASGKRLCTEAEWQAACEGPMATTYPYGNVYEPESCNGKDYDHDCTPPDNDRVLPTGIPLGCPPPMTTACVAAEWLLGTGGAVDMSGNLKEWTSTQVSTSPVTYRIRGGSYNNVSQGLTCQFDFVSAEPDFLFGNLGFRCCSDTAP